MLRAPIKPLLENVDSWDKSKGEYLLFSDTRNGSRNLMNRTPRSYSAVRTTDTKTVAPLPYLITIPNYDTFWSKSKT